MGTKVKFVDMGLWWTGEERSLLPVLGGWLSKQA